MLKITYAVTLLFCVLGAVVLYFAVIARRRAVAEEAKINRVFGEARRALSLIEKDESKEILVGLEILSAYDIPSVRMRAFPRLMRLMNHSDKQVASLAHHIVKLSQSGEVHGQRTAIASEQLPKKFASLSKGPSL